jgi:HSP90 family molecular chaperone
VIEDDGSGMTLEKFLEVIQHIGGSWKRLENKTGASSKYHRPLIGRIGMADVCARRLADVQKALTLGG